MPANTRQLPHMIILSICQHHEACDRPVAYDHYAEREGSSCQKSKMTKNVPAFIA
jgi:hypothetical protein